MRTERQKVYEALGNVEPDRAKAIREEIEPAAPATEARGEEALRIERQRTEKLLEAMRAVDDRRVCATGNLGNT